MTLCTPLISFKNHKSIDSRKIAIIGGSRGAYISAYIITKIPLSAAVLNYGGYDPVKVDEYWDETGRERPTGNEKAKKEVVTDKDIIMERSPIYHANKINTPVLLIHGDKDIVVPVEQSIVFAENLKKEKRYVEIKTFKGADHGFIFNNTEKAKEAFNLSVRFFNKFLK